MWPATPLESLTSQNLLTLLKTISLRPPLPARDLFLTEVLQAYYPINQ